MPTNLTITNRNISPETQELLRRNGMRAALAQKDDVYYLAAKNHDSPAVAYAVTPAQLEALTGRGSRQADRLAYQTFTQITGRDYYTPTYVEAARNYGRTIYLPSHDDRVAVAWSPRLDNAIHYQHLADIRAERRGFYRRDEVIIPMQDELMMDLENIVFERQPAIKEHSDVKPLSELITQESDFTNEKWKEALSSHGIIIDETSKTMTLQATNQPAIVYDLRDDEIKALTTGSLKESTYENRVNILNSILTNDFTSQLTIDMLNERQKVDLTLKEGIALHAQRDELIREEPVLAITIEPQPRKKETTEAKYKMTAVVNGETVTHEISQEDLNKFRGTDNYHRALLFNRIFKEVDKDIDVTTELNRALADSQSSQQAPEIYMSHQEENKETKITTSPQMDLRAIASKQFDLAMETEQSQGMRLTRS